MMRHIQLSFMTLIVIVILLWLVSYLHVQVGPVKKVAPVPIKGKDKVRAIQLLHHQHAPHKFTQEEQMTNSVPQKNTFAEHVSLETIATKGTIATKETIATKDKHDFSHPIEALTQSDTNDEALSNVKTKITVNNNRDANSIQIGNNFPVRQPESNSSEIEQTPPTGRPEHRDKSQDHVSTQCTPKKNIVFFKTHKCATSTVQNIMFRYGDKHQLRFVLPKTKKDHRFSLKVPFERRRVLTRGRKWSPQEQFNIFTNHAIFNKEELEAVMPPDTIYVSILRNPVTMFESIYTYQRFDQLYSPDDTKHLVSLEEFLDKATYYYNMDQVYSRNYSRNPMLYDFGLNPKAMDDITKINDLISIIDQRFDLVMNADYFEESLIMLKHLLCLNLIDIAFLTVNARSDTSVQRISDSLAKKIQKWNWADGLLYEHFNRTFHEKLAKFDVDLMNREKQELEKMNMHLKKYCVADVVTDMESVWHPDGVKIEGFRLKEDQKNDAGICKMLTRPEKVYTDILRQRQSLPQT